MPLWLLKEGSRLCFTRTSEVQTTMPQKIVLDEDKKTTYTKAMTTKCQKCPEKNLFWGGAYLLAN